MTSKPVATQDAKRRRKVRTLEESTLSVMRAEISRLESRVRSAEQNLASNENEHTRLERRASSAEEAAETLFNAIRVLASAIPSTTAQGRKVRQEARVILERKKITPPSSLGSSRNRGKKSKVSNLTP